MRHDLGRAHAAQQLDLVRLDPLEAVTVGDVVDDPHEPRERVGQRAVEVEDDELAAHGECRLLQACCSGGADQAARALRVRINSTNRVKR